MQFNQAYIADRAKHATGGVNQAVAQYRRAAFRTVVAFCYAQQHSDVTLEIHEISISSGLFGGFPKIPELTPNWPDTCNLKDRTQIRKSQDRFVRVRSIGDSE